MTLDILPTRTARAAENMATDFLLLQRYPDAAVARFRHYDWASPAVTFGYAQKIAFVREQLATMTDDTMRLDVCRRPTGGGIVDHRDDWTYALVIPRGHPLEEQRAAQSYRLIHEALAGALDQQGVAAVTKQAGDESETPDTSGGVCFQRAERYDVVHRDSGAKIAGAAQKRNKHGLLFQGSIWRPAVARTDFDWDAFENEFLTRLAAALEAQATRTGRPEFNEDEICGLTEQYSSPDWLEYR